MGKQDDFGTIIRKMEYNLPDLAIKNGIADKKIFVWQPNDIYLILGRSNSADKSLNISQVKADEIKIMQRPSGGETVILSPKMLVIAVSIPIIKGISSRDYFIGCNKIIIDELQKLGVKDLSTKGISDISIGKKKILGSAIYRSTESVFYHAVLNVSEDIQLISKYILHPEREPDYRQGRSHSEFVTSLHIEGYKISIAEIKNKLEGKIVFAERS